MNAVLTVVVLFLIWSLYEVLIKKLILDNSRDNIFAIRHELFMLATDNSKFKFDSKLYREMEIIINSNIRYLHKVNYITLITNFILTKNIDKNEIPSFNKLIKNAEENERYDKKVIEQLKKIKSKLDSEILKYLVKNSIILSLLFLFVSICIIFNFISHIIKNQIKTISWKNEYKDKFVSAVMEEKVSSKLVNAVERIAQKDIKFA